MSPMAPSPPAPSPPAWVAPGPPRPEAEVNSPAFETLWAQAQKLARREAGVWRAQRQGPHQGIPPLGPTAWRPLALEAPAQLGEGAAIAQGRLAKLMAHLARRPIPQGLPNTLPVQAGDLVITLRPQAAFQQPGAYRLKLEAAGAGRRLVLEAKDALGWGYACHRAMAWLGWRAFHYLEAHRPKAHPKGLVALPEVGAEERWSPDKAYRIRAFAPHLYHPCALSLAVHQPSAQNLAHVEAYLDWLVATRQNMAVFLLLELDAPNRFWPQLRPGRPHAKALLPHWQAIVKACHARGLQARANVALANYVSRNAFAIHPGSAIVQNLGLAGLRSAGWHSAEAIAFQQAREASRPQLEQAIDAWMEAGWDGIVWNMGTSEFSPTDAPLTLAWLNDAAGHMAKAWPGKAMAANSHVPLRPWAAPMNESYYNILRFASPAVGSWSHTVQAYALTDPAPVYGGENFAHKLRLLAAATPQREDVYYPETSYWVSNDASVPLFLPVYAYNRARDVATLRLLPHLDGWTTFTTAWEGGYWLNDYLAAELTARPRAGLKELMTEAMAPWGPQATRARQLLMLWMQVEQRSLIEGGLIKDLQGFDALSEFGAQARRTPLVNQLLEGTNNVPERTRLRELMAQSPAKLKAFREGHLVALAQFARQSEALTREWHALGHRVPASVWRTHRELGLAMATTHCRAVQVHAVMQCLVAHALIQQKAGDLADRFARPQAWQEALAATAKGRRLVREAEALYRDPPLVAYGRAQGPTLWNDRLLTPVHEGRYWRNTLNEVAELVGEESQPTWAAGPGPDRQR